MSQILHRLRFVNQLRYATSHASSGFNIPPVVYLPSVSHLIHIHKLQPDIIERIPRSGPKNRLLKGDVLAYLGDPTILLAPGQQLSAPLNSTGTTTLNRGPQEYWSTDISLTKANQFAKLHHVSVQDVFVKAIAMSLKEVPEINPNSQFIYEKQVGLDVSTVLVSDIEKTSLKKVLSTSKSVSSDEAHHYHMCILDSTGSSIKDIYPILQGHQKVLLCLQEKLNFGSPAELSVFETPSLSKSKHSKTKNTDDFTDFFSSNLAQNTQSAPGVSSLKSSELTEPLFGKITRSYNTLDFLTGSNSSTYQTLEVDILTDASVVSGKLAQKFLNRFKHFIENPSKLI